MEKEPGNLQVATGRYAYVDLVLGQDRKKPSSSTRQFGFW